MHKLWSKNIQWLQQQHTLQQHQGDLLMYNETSQQYWIKPMCAMLLPNHLHNEWHFSMIQGFLQFQKEKSQIHGARETKTIWKFNYRSHKRKNRKYNIIKCWSPCIESSSNPGESALFHVPSLRYARARRGTPEFGMFPELTGAPEWPFVARASCPVNS